MMMIHRDLLWGSVGMSAPQNNPETSMCIKELPQRTILSRYSHTDVFSMVGFTWLPVALRCCLFPLLMLQN